MTIGSEMSQNTQNFQSPRIAIIGGGVAGATAAIHLGELGVNVQLLEKGPSLVNGPPICHLHAGGNLYREISEQQCVELLRQSVETIRLFPHTLNKRPTVIAIPDTDSGDPQDIIPRLNKIQACYQQLVDEDARNQIMDEPSKYYSLYQRDQLEQLLHQSQPTEPLSDEDWLIPFAKYTNLHAIKYPVVVVQEYGWSVFRLAASAELALNAMNNCQVRTHATLVNAEYLDHHWLLTYVDIDGMQHQVEADYLINACGYETGKVDDMAHYQRKRMVEFKAAYVTHWPLCQHEWPEVVFHGERGTPNGMAQLTPYADGVFQLHGMTEDITLFKDGLVTSVDNSSQPVLPKYLEQKILQGWKSDVLNERTQMAIAHVSQFMPEFAGAEVGGKPLYGAQQIPGNDATLRAADVSFEDNHYARLEVVKGSSALEAVRKIVSTWELDSQNTGASIEEQHPISMSLSASDIEVRAKQLADERGYPQALAKFVGMK
ncbi:MAG: FAD-dependent oxidoreductase [Vibrio sp.]|uniref:FAD-dependent oxidoreductase n=1 Tax=Vibrio sp. TaxID=678 RepID=UPI003A85D182